MKEPSLKCKVIICKILKQVKHKMQNQIVTLNQDLPPFSLCFVHVLQITFLQHFDGTLKVSSGNGLSACVESLPEAVSVLPPRISSIA
jgi:hypothetical protein